MKIHPIFIPSVFTNCFLLADEATGKAALIDPGDGDAKTLATLGRLLTDNGYTLDSILLTHGHYDHVGGVNAVRAAYPGVTVWLHPADAGQTDPLRPTAGLEPVERWQDGDTVKVGTLTVTVLHTPGHTPGSVCLRCGEALFSGDTLFQESMGRTDFPGGSDQDILRSLKKLAQLPGDFQVYPGHEAFTTLEHERQHNYYMKAAVRSAP